MVTRRSLLLAGARAIPAAAGAGWLSSGFGTPWATAVAAEPWAWLGGREDLLKTAPRARYWTNVAMAGPACHTCHTPGQTLTPSHQHERDLVKCLLCAQSCAIRSGKSGKCRARINVNGELRSLVYGRPAAAHVDPIEKKPFFHFLPGASALSFGTSGCPLHCRFCQNWELSQSTPGDLDTTFTTPAALVNTAATRRAPVIAFTYNEPTVFTEYLLDVAAEAATRGIRSVMVSCGFATEAPLADICRALSAIKIDLKGFSDDFYRKVCSAELQPVLRSIKQVAKSGKHLEIVNLVVPTLNDSDKSLDGLASWVMGELGPDVPLHFTRFHPDYQLQNLPPTPVSTLERARSVAMAKGIRYAYVGNVPGHDGAHTYCPGCRKVVIRRDNFFVTEMHLEAGACVYCRRPIAGVWV
jgi:pyruvate formate lyase activating enzyme